MIPVEVQQISKNNVFNKQHEKKDRKRRPWTQQLIDHDKEMSYQTSHCTFELNSKLVNNNVKFQDEAPNLTDIRIERANLYHLKGIHTNTLFTLTLALSRAIR